MDLVREKGMFSFYEDGHGECCRIRKVRRRLGASWAQGGGRGCPSRPPLHWRPGRHRRWALCWAARVRLVVRLA